MVVLLAAAAAGDVARLDAGADQLSQLQLRDALQDLQERILQLRDALQDLQERTLHMSKLCANI